MADGIVWLSQQVQGSVMSRKIQLMKIRGQRQRPGPGSVRPRDQF